MTRIATLLVLLSACAVDSDDDDDDLGHVDQAYRQSQTLAASWGATVNVVGFGPGFTATVLGDHWLLTAAHAEGAIPLSGVSLKAMVGGVLTEVYSGPVDFYKHSSLDIALIHLRAKRIAWDRRAKLYDGGSDPWYTQSGPLSWVEGFGPGPTDCASGAGTLRGLATYTFGNASTAYFQPYLSCDGDSGGPWGWKIAGGDLVQYGVNFGKSNYFFTTPVGYRSQATVVRAALPFLESTMSAHQTGGISVSSGTLGGYAYRSYTENVPVGTLDDGAGTWCMEAGASGTISLQPCDGGYDQIWINYADGGLRPYAYSWMCAAVPSLAYGQRLSLAQCNGDDKQLFRHDTDRTLRSAANPGLCVERQGETAGANVRLTACAYHPWSLWTF